jgi:hypothetical protein
MERKETAMKIDPRDAVKTIMAQGDPRPYRMGIALSCSVPVETIDAIIEELTGGATIEVDQDVLATRRVHEDRLMRSRARGAERQAIREWDHESD